jgi:peptide/nickel transport system substrate-binding protein
MRAVKFLIYGIPLLLSLLFLGAFWNATQLSTSRKNELTIGSLGEPTKINPILSTDGAASQVESLIFEGLLRYSADLELEPGLAREFALSQTTTFFFASPEFALAARGILLGLADRWAEWTLRDVVADGRELRIDLVQPGLDTSRLIADLLTIEPITIISQVRAELGKDARAMLAAFRVAHPEVDVVREWFDYDAVFEISVLGSGASISKMLEAFLLEQKVETPAVKLLDELNFLAEPVVRFTLRDGVLWQDGVEFTSRDVAFTFWALTDASIGSPRKPDFDLIQSLKTPTPHEVVVTYRKPFSPALGSWTMPIIPAHILEEKPIAWWDEFFHRNPVGLGPFKFAEWKTNEFIRLERNPKYYGGAPWLDAIVIRTLPDPIANRLAFETHQVDYWNVDPWAVKAFQEDPRFDVFSAPAKQYNWVGWNLRLPVFQDLRVRQAFAHAVNVPDMIKYVLYGNGVQSTGIFPPMYWFANPDIEPIPYDPDRARALLDEAGWKVGPDGIRVKDGERLSFKLITNQGNETRKDIATLVQDNLKGIGVDVQVEIYEWAVFISRFVMKQEFESLVLAWTTPPDYDAFQVWHSSQTNADQLNLVGYNSPKVDRLLEQIRQEYDREKIIEMAGQIQRTIYEDQPLLFLYVPDSTSVVWKDTFRIRRPAAGGEWLDTPIEMTKAGWTYYLQWFYRPEYADKLPPAEIATP